MSLQLSARLVKAVKPFRGDAGTSLPEAIVAVAVSATMLGAIAGGIQAVTALQHTAATTAESIRRASTVDMRWRESIDTAVAITPTDGHTVTMSIPTANGGCRTDAWTFDSTVGLEVAATFHPTLSGRTCTGAQAGPKTEETLLAANADVTFHFRNVGGRDMDFSSGAVTLATRTQPAGVTDAAWASTTVGSAYLDGAVIVPGQTNRAVHSSQIANAVLNQ